MDDLEQIQIDLKESQEFVNALAEHIDKNFKIVCRNGVADLKKIDKLFRVELPDDINFATIISTSKKLFDLYQHAAYYRDTQNVQLSILEQAKVDKYHEAYQSAREENEKRFNKPLAAESCKVAALLATKGTEDAIVTQKVLRDFWAKICDRLTEMRKILEIMSYALSNDARLNKEFTLRTGD